MIRCTVFSEWIAVLERSSTRARLISPPEGVWQLDLSPLSYQLPLASLCHYPLLSANIRCSVRASPESDPLRTNVFFAPPSFRTLQNSTIASCKHQPDRHTLDRPAPATKLASLWLTSTTSGSILTLTAVFDADAEALDSLCDPARHPSLHLSSYLQPHWQKEAPSSAKPLDSLSPSIRLRPLFSLLWQSAFHSDFPTLPHHIQ